MFSATTTTLPSGRRVIHCRCRPAGSGGAPYVDGVIAVSAARSCVRWECNTGNTPLLCVVHVCDGREILLLLDNYQLQRRRDSGNNRNEKNRPQYTHKIRIFHLPYRTPERVKTEKRKTIDVIIKNYVLACHNL